jgi:hypothetical protein
VFFFGVFGGFLTYPLIALVSDVHALVGHGQVSPSTLLALAGVPLLYVALVAGTLRLVQAGAGELAARAIALAALVRWVTAIRLWFARADDRRDQAAPAPWVLVASWWQAMAGEAPCRWRARSAPAISPTFGAPVQRAHLVAARRASMILIVLESVAARWSGLNHGPDAEPARRVGARPRLRQFRRVQAHPARSDRFCSTFPSSISAISPKNIRGCRASIASVFRDRGYRTAFVTEQWTNRLARFSTARFRPSSITISFRARHCSRPGAWRIAAPWTA